MKEAAKFTKCETFTSIYKVGMISSGLCILYIYMRKQYTSDGVYTKNYELSSLFLDDGNFPLKMI